MLNHQVDTPAPTAGNEWEGPYPAIRESKRTGVGHSEVTNLDPTMSHNVTGGHLPIVSLPRLKAPADWYYITENQFRPW